MICYWFFCIRKHILEKRKMWFNFANKPLTSLRVFDKNVGITYFDTEFTSFLPNISYKHKHISYALSINNSEFEDIFSQIYTVELNLNDTKKNNASASCPYSLHSNGRTVCYTSFLANGPRSSSYQNLLKCLCSNSWSFRFTWFSLTSDMFNGLLRQV